MLGWISGGRPGFFEVLLIIVVVLVFFGAKRLPELARALGKSINEFKKGRQEGAAEGRDKQEGTGGKDPSEE